MEHRIIYTRLYDSEVEYLKSTGTQWIDTGVYGTSDTTIEFTSSFSVNSYNDTMSVGVISWTEDQGKSLGFIYNASSKLFYMFLGNGPKGSRVTPELVSNTTYHFVVKQDGVWMDSQKIYDGYYSGSISTRYTIPFFARIDQGSGNLKYSTTGTIFYNLKIYNGTTLVRDFIPVRKGSTGYMYDRVSKKLFANQGTGNFILGPDVANQIPNIRRVFRFGNKRFVMPIRVVKEVHVTIARFPFRTNVDNVVYTQDINRRKNSTQTPTNISSSGQNFPVWAWTENNERGYLTCFIGCEYFYPQYGSKLVVHSNLSQQNTNGIFRGMKVKNLDFCKCWDVTYITSLATAFKDTSITDFSGIQNWNLINLTSMYEMASQLSASLDFRPFLKMGVGNKVANIGSMFYGNALRDTTDWSPMCSNYHWKLVSPSSSMTYLPYCNYLDMTNWDLTEWNEEVVTSLFAHGAGALKIKTPILPLTVKPMKLPYTYYDMETEQAYTEIPLNLDRQLTLYKNKSDIGK